MPVVSMLLFGVSHEWKEGSRPHLQGTVRMATTFKYLPGFAAFLRYSDQRCKAHLNVVGTVVKIIGIFGSVGVVKRAPILLPYSVRPMTMPSTRLGGSVQGTCRS